MKQPWLSSAAFDGCFILLPPFFATLGVAILFAIEPSLADKAMSPWAWLVLVLAIDVSHVYASVYRTVLSPDMRDRYGLLLVVSPILAYLVGHALYQKDPLWFWRALAYLAVFHFVRQPYGLMMLYKRKGPREPRLWHGLDQVAIYTASLYPIWCWHFDETRTFHWFVEGDFFRGHGPAFIYAGHAFAALVFGCYGIKEIAAWRQGSLINVPKNLVLLGTAVSFGFGILYWNSDLAFTATNVIGHGVAYLGLVWWSDGKRWFHSTFSRRFEMLFPVGFVVLLFVLAFFEEGLWDALVWDEHKLFFASFGDTLRSLGLGANEGALAFLVPLLALPQATHYIWDGFIWKNRAKT